MEKMNNYNQNLINEVKIERNKNNDNNITIDNLIKENKNLKLTQNVINEINDIKNLNNQLLEKVSMLTNESNIQKQISTNIYYSIAEQKHTLFNILNAFIGFMGIQYYYPQQQVDYNSQNYSNNEIPVSELPVNQLQVNQLAITTNSQ
jgi:hypothetical protein